MMVNGEWRQRKDRTLSLGTPEVESSSIPDTEWALLRKPGPRSAFSFHLRTLHKYKLTLPRGQVRQVVEDLGMEEIIEIAKRFDPDALDHIVNFAKGAVEARDPCETDRVLEIRAKLLADLQGQYLTPKREETHQ